jgi:hypothetical protein
VTRVSRRADWNETRSGSVMIFPAIASCNTHAGANDSRNRRGAGAAAAAGTQNHQLSDAAAAWGRRRRHVIAALTAASWLHTARGRIRERRISGEDHE